MTAARRLLGFARREARRARGHVFEGGLRIIAPLVCPPERRRIVPPRRVFVLRNNDLGDVLVATPLLEALSRTLPGCEIAIGVGPWAAPILDHNPHASARIVPAPWLNKYVSPQTFAERWRFVRRDPAALALTAEAFDIGIDFAGTRWGALLLRRCGIPVRLGIRGYAGGHSLATGTVPFDPSQHVARLGLRFAEMLGATELPAVRPRLYLSPSERALGLHAWGERPGPRIALAPGGGLQQKCWPASCFAELAASIGAAHSDANLLVIGGPADEAAVAAVVRGGLGARTLGRSPGLRELFAIVAAADAVICNSSLVLHVAAAFGRPALVLLGPAFSSATQHQAQWGYPGLSTTLGAEPGDRSAPAVSEALAGFEQITWPRAMAAESRG